MEFYELTLPYPPTNNHYKGIVRNPKNPKLSRTGKPLVQFYVSKETETYRTIVRLKFNQKGIATGDKKLRVEIDVHDPLGKRGYDLDNIPKVVLDALQKAGAFKNDYCINHLILTRREKHKDGMLKIKVNTLD